MSKWFEIFKVGTWNGREYKKEDLDKMVENFETGDPKVPLIIGHNDFFGGEKPAEGWVQGLKRQGNKLMAQARNISDTLKAAVNDERYPMRSVELWPDYNGKGIALGAVAFLGGSNPAVGGMADFQFAGDTSGRLHFAAEENNKHYFAYAPEGDLGEDFAAKSNGGGEIDMTKEQIDQMIAAALGEATPKIIEQFKSGADYQSLVTANAELQTQVTEAQTFATKTILATALAESTAFAKRMLDEKRITPAQHSGLASFLLGLDNTDKVKFAGDTEQTRREFFQAFVQGLPAQTALFSDLDGSAPRANEDIDGTVVAFAKEHGLDPQVLATQFARQRKVVAEDGELQANGVSVSLG